MPATSKAQPAMLHPPATRLTSRELMWMGLLFLLVMLAITVLAGALEMVVRYFWLDEIITYTLASDPSLSHMLSALLHGTDSNPPAYHLLLWSLHAIGMPLNETTLRLVSVAAIFAALLGLYASLRFVFSRPVSAVAVLALFAGQTVALGGVNLPGELLIRLMFEARFYAPWLAICAWFGYCLIALRVRPSWPTRIGLGALGFLMLTVHYFGLFTFVLMVLADGFADSRPWRARLVARLPLLTAIPALAIVGYFYLHQSQAFTARSWVNPATLGNSLQFLWEVLAPFPLLIIVGALGLAWIRRRSPKTAPATPSAPAPHPARLFAGLLALALLPWVVLAFSWMIQPASEARYAFPGLAATAIVAAWLLSPLPRAMVLALGLIFVAVGVIDLHAQAADMYVAPIELHDYLAHLEQFPADEPIFFELRLDYYPAVLYYPDLRTRMAILDFRRGEVPADTFWPSRDYAIVERDAQRAAAAFYPQFRSFPQSRLARGGRFVLIAANPDPVRISRRFGASEVRYIMGREFEITLPP